jgi:hypothetical protein
MLESNEQGLWDVVERDDGTVVLGIVPGTIGWYEMHIP